jgi:rRNA-processing protein FCF1
MSEAPPPESAVAFVVDTSILLASLPLLQQRASALSGLAFFVAPWTALRELDGLSKSEKQHVSQSARRATHALEALLKSQPAVWRGETGAEARAAAIHANALAQPGDLPTGDERILSTALALRDKGRRVALLTNDTNLRVCATVHGMPSIADCAALPANPQQLQALFEGDFVSKPSFTEEEPAAMEQTHEAAPMLSLDNVLAESHRAVTSAVELATALDCLSEGCSAFFEKVFREEYGTFWREASGEALPWNGRSILRILRKQWAPTLRARLPRAAREAGSAAEGAVKACSSHPRAVQTAACAVAALLDCLSSSGIDDCALQSARLRARDL